MKTNVILLPVSLFCFKKMETTLCIAIPYHRKQKLQQNYYFLSAEVIVNTCVIFQPFKDKNKQKAYTTMAEHRFISPWTRYYSNNSSGTIQVFNFQTRVIQMALVTSEVIHSEKYGASGVSTSTSLYSSLIFCATANVAILFTEKGQYYFNNNSNPKDILETVLPIKHPKRMTFLQQFLNISLMQCSSHNQDYVINHVTISEEEA